MERPIYIELRRFINESAT